MKKYRIYPLLLAVLSTILLIAASPGVFSGYIVFIAIVPVLLSTVKSSNTEFTVYSLIFCLTYYIISLKWVTVAVSHFGNAPIVVGYLVLSLFAVYLSVYWILFLYFVRNNYDAITLSLLFVILEIVRGKLFTGFPWLNLGSFLHDARYLSLNASVLGEEGLTFIIVLSNILLYKFILFKNKKYLISFTLLLGVCFTTGFILDQMKSSSDRMESFTIVQPSYSQESKWLPEHKEKIITKVMEMSEKALNQARGVVILPESVFPTFTESDTNLYGVLDNYSAETPIIFGSIRQENDDSGKMNFYNSVYYLNDGKSAIYDKNHLVPFGEYFPFKALFKPINYYFFGDAQDFSRGNSISIFRYNNINLSPLLCYEGAFTDIVKRVIQNNGDVILLLTNDSWFGKSIGRYQHLAIDEIRSIEYGVPIVRAAQSGISGCIDRQGNISGKTKIDEETISSCNVEISDKDTFFSRFGYSWIVILVLIYGGIWVSNYSKRK